MPTIPYKTKEGNRVSGVTTIIGQNLGWNKQQLMYWANQEGLAGRNHRDTSQKAADAGTIAHYLIECDIKRTQPVLTYDKELIDKAETCLLNFLHWKDMVNFEPITTELSLVSEIYGYGGTLDCPARIKGQVCLFDWKSSSGTYADYWIQMSAYVNLWNETQPEPLTGGVYLLRIDKEGASWDFHFKQDLSEYFKAFQHLLALHNLKKQLEKK
jgi:hypothetical protein